MNPKEEFDRLRNDLAALQRDGQKVISIDALQRYLHKVEMGPSPSPEEKQHELQRSLAYYDAKNKLNLELFRSGDDAGKEALKASLLINGGAVIAILSFLGAVVGKITASKLGLALVPSLQAFGFGVLLSALAFGARYFTSYAMAFERSASATKFNILAILLAIGSYGGFAFGVYWAYLAFRVYFSSAP